MILDIIDIWRKHNRPFIPDLTKAMPPKEYLGRPEISTASCADNCQACVDNCPTDAISLNPLKLDLGACHFCSECVRVCPEEKFSLKPDHLMATTTRKDLIVYEGQTTVLYDPAAIRAEISKLFGQSLKLRQVSAGGDNSNEMELNAADNINFDMSRYGIEWVASPRHADGIVVTGPITVNMARALQICYDSVPAPKLVILVGPEAISGGLYKGSSALDRRFLDHVKIDLYIPGNPIHPLTFLNGLLRLLNIIPTV